MLSQRVELISSNLLLLYAHASHNLRGELIKISGYYQKMCCDIVSLNEEEEKNRWRKREYIYLYGFFLRFWILNAPICRCVFAHCAIPNTEEYSLSIAFESLFIFLSFFFWTFLSSSFSNEEHIEYGSACARCTLTTRHTHMDCCFRSIASDKCV